jgi:hypothetical protein
MGQRTSKTGAAVPRDGWFYARTGHQGGRQGPVSLDRLRKLAQKGWLATDDLIWHHDLPGWIPAGAGSRLRRVVRKVDQALAGLAGSRRRRARVHQQGGQIEQAEGGRFPTLAQTLTDPELSVDHVAATVTEERVVIADEPMPGESAEVQLSLETMPPRYLLALGGLLLAALGGIFMLVRPTPLATALLAFGGPLLLVCLAPEIGRLGRLLGMAVGHGLLQGVDLFRAARQRSQAQQDVALREAALRRQGRGSETEADATETQPAGPLQAGTVTRYEHDSLRGMVVIREPSIKLWSRPVAGVLSVCPGLGQFKNYLNLNGHSGRQGRHSKGAAGADTAIGSPDLSVEFTAAIDHRGLLREVGWGVDHAEQFDHAADAVKAAKFVGEGDQTGKPCPSSSRLALFNAQVITDSTGHQTTVGQQRQMPRDKDLTPDNQTGLVEPSRFGDWRQVIGE